ncbi:MAG: BrnT family toxin [Nitrospirota bacterium]|nr:BrnT family toxin [Nitrospirota bacterium]
MFEWNASKAEANLAKHGVSFEEAASVFLDSNGLDGPDLNHSVQEARYLRLGRSSQGRILMVAYTVRRNSDGENIRLISARRASQKERKGYREISKD